MFESVIEEKKSEIDKLSERKKSEIDYIAKIAREYYDSLVTIFDPNRETPSRKLENIIFEETLRRIEIINEYCEPIGANLYHEDPRHFDTQFQLKRLGWIDLYKSPGIEALTIRTTEKGYEVLDGLRKIRGQIPKREANKHFSSYNR